MRLTAALLLLLAATAGCERPLVDPLQSPIETVGTDLDEVRTEAELPLRLRVGGATDLTVNGTAAVLDAGTGVFSRTLTLAPGLNALAVRATDPSGVVAADTLYALFLPITVDAAAASGLPSARSEAAMAASGDRVFVTGGVGGSSAALATVAVLAPSGRRFVGTDGPLLTARAGHTASVLPGGGVLLVGGARLETPAAPADFVTTAEWIPPGQTQPRAVTIAGGLPRRAGHTARVLTDGAQTTLYLYGGLVPEGAGVAPSGTIDVFRWTLATETLERLSPDGGAGAFAAVAGHLQIPVLGSDGASGRATDLVFGGALAARLDFSTPGTSYPFSLDARTLAPLAVPRTDAAGAPIQRTGLALIAGGRDAQGTLLSTLEVYSVQAERAFRVPAGIRLAAARAGAAATLLPDGRILVAGGRTETGSASAFLDVLTF